MISADRGLGAVSSSGETSTSAASARIDDRRRVAGTSSAGDLERPEPSATLAQCVARSVCPRKDVRASRQALAGRAGLDAILRSLRRGRSRRLAAPSSPFADEADLQAMEGDFDAAFYRAANPDVAAAGVDPIAHFHSCGWREGRNPRSDFDTRAYLEVNPDVAAAGLNPFLHYLRYGRAEGRSTGLPAPGDAGLRAMEGDFDAAYYLASNPDVAAAGLDPLMHWTHVHDAACIDLIETERQAFAGGRVETATVAGFTARYFHRRYDLQHVASAGYIGGLGESSVWLSRDDLFGALDAYGFDVLKVVDDPYRNGGGMMPPVNILATRRGAGA